MKERDLKIDSVVISRDNLKKANRIDRFFFGDCFNPEIEAKYQIQIEDEDKEMPARWTWIFKSEKSHRWYTVVDKVCYTFADETMDWLDDVDYTRRQTMDRVTPSFRGDDE